jgi:CRP-like cAMP-binding protein
MSGTTATNNENHLISLLPRKERDQILEICELVEIIFGTVLCEPDQPFSHVYFPLSGYISLVKSVQKHPPMEVGLIGNEGMLGAKLVLGVNNADLQGVVQGPGIVLRMTTMEFLRILRDNPDFKIIIKRYLSVLMSQLSQTIACSRFHEVTARLARWLLLTHDRTIGDQFNLTHRYLAEMLGVQRSAITIAAGLLQQKKIIHYVRGDIRILNRKALEAASCECYNAVNDDYFQIFA